LFYSLAIGFVGTEAAIAFTDFAKNIDRRVEADDIFNNWSKVKGKVEKLGQERYNVLNEKCGEWFAENHATVTDQMGKNFGEYFRLLPFELRIDMWTRLANKGSQRLEGIKKVYPNIVKEILEVFGTEPGKRGQKAIVPDFLSKKDSLERTLLAIR